jgi:chemotaxis protein methyltransferase CheR
LKRRGDVDGARRSFRNAYRICAAMPPEAPIFLAEGELAGTMARAVASELAWLSASEEAAS